MVGVGLGEELQTKEPLIRNISDTACWAAWYRAHETAREDAVFRDPYAARLAGERGREIAQQMKFSTKHSWSWVSRTYLFDHYILEQIGLGADMVVNLACGLDTRPYRMNLPQDLQWVEVDLGEVLDYKEAALKDEKPECRLERVRVDLAQVEARRKLFAELGTRAKTILVITEGVLSYFTEEEVAELAKEFSAQPAYHAWILDLSSPALIKMLNKNMAQLKDAGTPLLFGPAQGTRFFEPFGWKTVEASSLLHCAGKIKRLPMFMKIWTLLPDTKGRNPKQVWGGVVMLERI